MFICLTRLFLLGISHNLFSLVESEREKEKEGGIVNFSCLGIAKSFVKWISQPLSNDLLFSQITELYCNWDLFQLQLKTLLVQFQLKLMPLWYSQSKPRNLFSAGKLLQGTLQGEALLQPFHIGSDCAVNNSESEMQESPSECSFE